MSTLYIKVFVPMVASMVEYVLHQGYAHVLLGGLAMIVHKVRSANSFIYTVYIYIYIYIYIYLYIYIYIYIYIYLYLSEPIGKQMSLSIA